MADPIEGNPAIPGDATPGPPNPPADPIEGNPVIPGDATPGPPNSPADPEVPKELWYIGLGISLLLILAGLFGMAIYDRLYSVGALAVCIGFGIVLVIFGTRASGNFLTFAVVGSGAMAIALYLLLRSYPIAVAPSYMVGDIYNTSIFNAVRGSGKRVFLTGQLVPNGDFRFVIAGDEIGNRFVKFSFDLPDGYLQSDGSELKEFSINCISAVDLKTSIDHGESLSLEEGAGGEFKLVEASSGRKLGRMNAQDCNAPSAEPTIVDEVGFLSWFFSPAYAQDSTAFDIPKAVAILESDDGYLRDLARDQLASLRGAEAYEAVVGSWNISESSYRADLGRLVAWSSAIRQDRASAVTLAEALTADQLSYVVQLTGQGDITMRQYATEVLHRLLETTSWPNGPSAERAQEIVAATLSVLSPLSLNPLTKPSMQFSPDNLLYNTIVAIGFAECNIGATYRPLVAVALSDLAVRLRASAASPKTNAKLANVLDALKACP